MHIKRGRNATQNLILSIMKSRCDLSLRFLCCPTAFFLLLEPWDIRKTADLPLQLLVSTFPRFVAIRFYFLSETPKPLNKSLHQSFFYSFITILPSESGVTLHCSTILVHYIKTKIKVTRGVKTILLEIQVLNFN